MNEIELSWAAGFIEGEGYFSWSGTPYIGAEQTAEREPLDRLMKLFGGNIMIKSAKWARDHGQKARDAWRWRVNGVPAVIAMFQLYPLLTSRRKRQIVAVLEKVLEKNDIGVRGAYKNSPYAAVVEFVSKMKQGA